MSIVVYLRKDRQERFNLKRHWFVNAWRLVDINGEDRVQPWFNKLANAKAFAKSQGWIIGGEYRL